MNSNFTCEQVMALISYYIEDKLNPALKYYVDSHIENCPECAKKLSELKNIFLRYGNYCQNEPVNKEDEAHGDKDLLKNLSAYIDNELSTNDNIKIRKITVSNPSARKKLEMMYNFQKLLHSAYAKTKNDAKTDYSKNVISIITNASGNYTTTYFKKLIILFVIFIFCILAGVIYLYS